MSTAPTGPPRGRNAGDIYLRALACGLVGYAALGKGFAYVGAPPLFVGEILFVSGLLMLIRTGCLLTTFTMVPNLLLAILGAWAVARTVPFLGVYGLDAVRDSVIVLYGGFGVVVCAMLVERPARLNDAFRFARVLATWFGPCAWILYCFSELTANIMPSWPGSGMPLLSVKPGDVAVHLAGSAVFALLLFRRISPWWVLMVLLSAGVCVTQSRGGMLSIVIPLGMAALIGGRIRSLLRFGAMLLIVLGLGYAFNIEFDLPSRPRPVSGEQMVENLASIFFNAADDTPGALDGTKEWRRNWWQAIEDYTFSGPFFWGGKGFGIGLAEADGFLGADESQGLSQGVTRSPHNASMTILARAGVPGLVLWILLLTSWFAVMLRSVVEARLLGEQTWAAFLLYLTCYLLAILINASFDVALEGPMLGIWFWILFGVGCGAVMIFRTQCALAARRAAVRDSGRMSSGPNYASAS